MPPRPKVLNDVFQQAADQARQKLPQLTQNQQVREFDWKRISAEPEVL